MKIGIPKEIKVKEHRVAATPSVVRTLVDAGHEVLVERGAGVGSGFSDDQYARCGAVIVASAADVWSADMVVKVKEPVVEEWQFLRPGLVLFTFLHLAANRALTEVLVRSRTTAIGYETVQVGSRLVLLEPMSEIAGRMSVIVGAYYLAKTQGGNGVLLSGLPGVLPGKVLIVGGGTAGVGAARVAAGVGAEVTILEIDAQRMRFLDVVLQGAVRTLWSDEQNLLELLPSADLLVGAVSVPGAKAPKLIRRDMLKRMKPGAVFVDIAIDQGGCAETSRPTTHEAPVYVEDGVLHYCVANMPAAYARTATQALTNVTRPYVLKLANLGAVEALRQMEDLRRGLNTYAGMVTHQAVAEAHSMPYCPAPF
ncbi:MAG: alanine dehydrogenase [Verrucomicrobiae bacterium]|nr:alanine dehydrogenase [Verrucomicrobiae bacterium]